MNEQMRYQRLRHNPLICSVMPVDLAGDHVYIVAALVVVNRSDAEGAKMLNGLAPALRRMLVEAQQAPETVIDFSGSED